MHTSKEDIVSVSLISYINVSDSILIR